MSRIDYTIILENLDKMIEVLEYDSMRSSGKAKLNSQHLHSMYYLKEKYEQMLKTKPTPSPKKEG